MRIIPLLIIFALSSCNSRENEIRIFFTGDVILDRGVDDMIKLYGDSLLVNSLRKIGKSDFFVTNYEGTFTHSQTKQDKHYNFNADIHYAELLIKGGVTHVSIANNHSFDFGEEGFTETLNVLRKQSLIILGETCRPKEIVIGNNRIAILAACLTTHCNHLCNSTIENIKKNIREYRENGIDTPLVVYIHWGNELQPSPLNWQKDFARDMIFMGVDVIIGHHPHIIQTIEFIDGKPVFYSLGNFVADGYLTGTDISYVVELTVNEQIIDVSIVPLELHRFFPKTISTNNQVSNIKKYLSYSEGICTYPMEDKWIIKSTKSINFQEDTDLWFFSEGSISATIKRLSSGSHLLTVYNQTDTSNTINIHGQLTDFRISDINNNGAKDFILGIKKKVNFDPVERKRINIYSFKNRSLQALWLGTKFIHDIESFEVKNIDGVNYLITFEVDNNNNDFHGTYLWDEFGFELIDTN
jgi:hypothetical protein